MKKDKRTNNGQQSRTQKTKDWATRTPLNPGVEPRCTGTLSISYSTTGTRRVKSFTQGPMKAAASILKSW
jgi:hypothetical protein